MLVVALLMAQTSPDIEVNVHATVREVRIRQRGETSLQVHASPDGGSNVRVANPPPNARAQARNRVVDIHAEARIAAPATNSPPAETSQPN